MSNYAAGVSCVRVKQNVHIKKISFTFEVTRICARTNASVSHDRDISFLSPSVTQQQMAAVAQEHQGLLMKACQRMCVVAWQTRYFVLRGASLLYYSDTSCSLLKGDIRVDTSGASVTKVLSE